jgi:uncharacterized protein (TIGR02246 family)
MLITARRCFHLDQEKSMSRPRLFPHATLLLCLTLLPAAGFSKEPNPPASARCTQISQNQVAALFNRWNAALGSGNPDTVARQYSSDAVLLPTAENGPLIGTAAIRGYFVHFLEKHPQGTVDQRTIRIGCNVAYDVGTYTFMLDGPQPGTRVKLPARFTFIYEPRGHSWLIVHHHSSANPVQSQ